jgi:hypothetical protein
VATLTALETLKFRAALSVPSNVLKTQRKERIQEVLEILGLWRVRDTKVQPFLPLPSPSPQSKSPETGTTAIDFKSSDILLSPAVLMCFPLLPPPPPSPPLLLPRRLRLQCRKLHTFLPLLSTFSCIKPSLPWGHPATISQSPKASLYTLARKGLTIDIKGSPLAKQWLCQSTVPQRIIVSLWRATACLVGVAELSSPPLAHQDPYLSPEPWLTIAVCLYKQYRAPEQALLVSLGYSAGGWSPAGRHRGEGTVRRGEETPQHRLCPHLQPIHPLPRRTHNRYALQNHLP